VRRRLVLFAADVNRFCPLATVVAATLVCLPSILLVLAGKLAMKVMLERYVLSLILATVAIRGLAKLVVRYAVHNVLSAEHQPAGEPVNSPPRGAVRQP
jgi:hypothetical protein